MGCWGMGMTQSDEFCEIYDNFMEEYDEGKAVAEITADILAKYHAEFDDDDGVMHDVYFALAKAEWMCCEQSELVLNRVKKIIESGANIEFYRELEATEKDLIVRGRNLDKFLKMLMIPRDKPRKRKRTAPAVEKTFPPLEVGDCFAYKYADGYRVIAILERFKPKKEKDQVSIVIFQGVYSADAVKTTDFTEEEMGHMFSVTADDFLGASVIKKVSHIEITPKSRARLLGVSAFMFGNKGTFRMEIKQSLGVSLKEFLYHCDENTEADVKKLEVGGCYAYKYKDGYRFAAILDNLTLESTEYWMIAILSEFSNVPNIDFLNTSISSCTMYDKDALPNLIGWKKITTIDVPSNLQKRYYGRSRYIISGIFDFLQDRSSLKNSRAVFRTLAPILECCKENSASDFAKLELGGCYAYKFGEGYKFAIILDRSTVQGEECVLAALLWKTYPSLCADYMNDGLSQVGIYSKDLLPNIEDWKLIDKLDLPENMTEKISKYNAITVECIARFFADPPYYNDTLTLGKFIRAWVYKEDMEKVFVNKSETAKQ